MTLLGMSAEAAARRALRQACWPVVLVLAVALAAVLRVMADGPPSGLGLVTAALAAGLPALVIVALSANLAFDALLFRLIASYEDELKGGAAVDDILVRMRLKARPSTPRPLAERIAGMQRLVNAQRAALAAFMAGSLLALSV